MLGNISRISLQSSVVDPLRLRSILNCGIFPSEIVNGLFREERYEEMAAYRIDPSAHVGVLSYQDVEMDR